MTNEALKPRSSVGDAQYPRIVAGELVNYKSILLITSVQGQS